MTPLDITNLLKEYGPWGIIALLVVVIVSLYRDLGRSNERAIADRDKVLQGLHAATTAAERMNGLLDGIKITLSTHKDASEDLTKQVELAAAENRHGLANVQTSLTAIVNRMDRDGARGRS